MLAYNTYCVLNMDVSGSLIVHRPRPNEARGYRVLHGAAFRPRASREAEGHPRHICTSSLLCIWWREM